MRASTQRLASEMAAAVRAQAESTARGPTVKAADWRLGTVATVGSDGTITTTDGIVARRVETYALPAVSDVVVLDVSGSGAWICRGRLSAGADGWVPLTVGSGWTAGSGSDLPPAGRRRPDGTVQLRGLVRMNTATPPATALTLPAGLVPANNKHMIAVTSYGIAYLQATSGGSITHASRSGALAINAWVSLDGVSYNQ